MWYHIHFIVLQMIKCNGTKIIIYNIILILLLNHPELWLFVFIQELFHKKSQIIHLYCFSQYVKYSHCGTIHFKKHLFIIFHIYQFNIDLFYIFTASYSSIPRCLDDISVHIDPDDIDLHITCCSHLFVDSCTLYHICLPILAYISSTL